MNEFLIRVVPKGEVHKSFNAQVFAADGFHAVEVGERQFPGCFIYTLMLLVCEACE